MRMLRERDEKRLLVMVAFLFLLTWLLTACASTANKLDPSVFYRRDMQITVNGATYDGVGVIPVADSYAIKIASLQKVDLLTATSCGRDDAFSPSDQDSNWFEKGYGYSYQYTPNTVEKNCLSTLEFGGFDQTKGQHSWGALVFQGKTFSLPMGLSCNGLADERFDGKAVCQTKVGLWSRIWFVNPVVVSAVGQDESCKMPVPQDQEHFDFQMPPKQCVFVFMEIKSGQSAELTTWGYDQIPIRGN